MTESSGMPVPPHAKTVVVTSLPAQWQTNVSTGDHDWLVDEPKSVEGGDLGPTPEEMLLASLGSCTAITLRMYAKNKAWPLERVEVTLEMLNAANNQLMETNIKREIKLFGALSDEQRERLTEIANKCPMHRVLSNPVHIATATTMGIELPN
jgi:putative redox protein